MGLIGGGGAVVLSSFRAAKKRKRLRPREGWREPERKEGERCTGGRKRGGGKQEKYGEIKQCSAIEKAQRGTVPTKIGRKV